MTPQFLGKESVQLLEGWDSKRSVHGEEIGCQLLARHEAVSDMEFVETNAVRSRGCIRRNEEDRRVTRCGRYAPQTLRASNAVIRHVVPPSFREQFQLWVTQVVPDCGGRVIHDDE